jgi:hypothetical protein
MSTKEAQLFIHQLLAQIRSNEQFVRNNNTDLYDCAWQNLCRATQISRKCISIIDNKGSDKENSTNLLLTNCLSDVSDALISTLSGFNRGPGVILRSVVENIAVIIVIQTDEKKYNQFINNKLSGHSQITAAKKYWPSIGDIYGFLSNLYVHEKYESSGRCLKNDKSDVIFSLLPQLDHDDLFKSHLILVSIISMIIGALSEYCHSSKINELYYWHREITVLIRNNDTYENNLIAELAAVYQVKI